MNGAKPTLRLKAPGRASSISGNGHAVRGWEAEKTLRDGEKEIVAGKSTQSGYAPARNVATVELALGLTIPGPPKSYMAARVDARVTLPCSGSTDEDVKAEFARAKALVEEQLEIAGKEVQEFFNEK